MKIKHHPTVLVNVYVDGRFEILAPKTVSNYRDALKVAALNMGIPPMIQKLGKIEPGRYEAIMTKFNPMRRSFSIDLNSVI